MAIETKPTPCIISLAAIQRIGLGETTIASALCLFANNGIAVLCGYFVALLGLNYCCHQLHTVFPDKEGASS